MIRHLLCLTTIALAGHHAALGQSPADLQAARESGFPYLLLVDPTRVDPRLGSLGIRLAYVDKQVTTGNRSQYVCGALSRERGAAAAQPVAAGLARLGDDGIRRLGLRYVMLCGGLQLNGRAVGGTLIPVDNLFLIDMSGGSDAAFQEEATLHELYHLAEVRSVSIGDFYWDQQFTGYLNSYTADRPKGAHGGGGPGFVSPYSTTFPSEDRAELFAALLLKPADILARIRATKDSVLRAKVLFMDQKSQRMLGVKLAPAGL